MYMYMQHTNSEGGGIPPVGPTHVEKTLRVYVQLTESLLLSSLWSIYTSPWDLEQYSILALKLILHQLPIDYSAI
jgi:hypothetical protein